MRRLSERLFPILAGILALGCVWLAVDAVRENKPLGSGYTFFMAGGAVLFAASALSVHFGWPAKRLLAFLSGIPLCLYAAAAVLVGREYLGGVAISLPLAAVTGLVGVMGLVLSSKDASSDRAT
jgi:hypothetical protein